MASEGKKNIRIRVSAEAKAILDRGKTSPAQKIDEWLGIGKKNVPEKVYENPETHLLDHAIIIALLGISKTDRERKGKAKLWETVIVGGTEHHVRNNVLGYFCDRPANPFPHKEVSEYKNWGEVYPHFFDKDTSGKNAKTTFGIAIQNRLKSLEKMGIAVFYKAENQNRWKLSDEYLSGVGYDQINSYTTECLRVPPSKYNTVDKLDIKTYEPIADSEEPLIIARELFNKTHETITGLMEDIMTEAHLLAQVEGQPRGEKIQIDTSKFNKIKQELGKYGVIADISITIHEDDEVDEVEKESREAEDMPEGNREELELKNRKLTEIKDKLENIKEKRKPKGLSGSYKISYSPDGKNEEVLAEAGFTADEEEKTGYKLWFGDDK
jgi:hypothetical protein